MNQPPFQYGCAGSINITVGPQLILSSLQIAFAELLVRALALLGHRYDA
jgi:hypothetical protein